MAKIATAPKSKKDNNAADNDSVIGKLLSTEIKFGKNQGVGKKKQEFFSELATLLEAGVDVKDALELIESGLKKGGFANIVAGIRESIINGKTMAEAFALSKVFSQYEIVSIRIGEESGQIERVMKELSVFFQKKTEQKRKMTSAFAYPVIVVLTAFAAIFFMMRFVVPMFEDVFKRFNNDLPEVTKQIIGISHWLGKNILYIIGAIVLTVVFVIRMKSKLWFRTIWHAILSRIPFFGDMSRKIYMTRFCTSMELLISSQTPLVSAMELVRSMIMFYPLEQALQQIEKDVVAGIPLHKSMKQFKVFDRKMISMVRVGEEVNQLAPMFSRLRELYEKETDHKTAIMGTVLEPLIIILVGLIVGVVLISMYLPMFKMSSSFGPGM
ncbi:MAG: type II secretion system F family protein [Bacteroidetes bacterium HGW-Bacteroidetes-6]|jgi:type IV pilus assembly protein PilC|nr:MAG: type II secretion system F family protein [Bacteroidetes bacterium HGW-Bacteroidetes-6]